MRFIHIRIVNSYQIGAIKRAITNHVSKFDNEDSYINWYCGIKDKASVVHLQKSAGNTYRDFVFWDATYIDNAIRVQEYFKKLGMRGNTTRVTPENEKTSVFVFVARDNI